jgi:phosphatidylglycerophosphatase A
LIKATAKVVFTHPIHLLAFGFGSGLSPRAPGTIGTIAAIPLYFFLSQLTLNYYLLACLFVSTIGIYICGKSAELLKTHDHPGIVWDEFAGFFITMIAVPFSWQNILLGFFLFRLFDIFKPWPISWVDKHVDGGLGIMIDDIIAGIFSLVCIHLVIHYLV